MRLKLLFTALALLGLGLFFVGCTSSEDENTIPWAQPTGWEGNKTPVGLPNYGDRSY